jgi:ferredoxin-NADP reductase
MNSFILPFLYSEKISSDAYSFYFNRSQVTDLDFIPGQYIRMILPHENPDERGTSRFFSIASSPTQKEILMITTKIGPSSFKKNLLGLQQGMEVQFFGPIGKFVFHKEDTRPRIFLAGGIGITPYHATIKYAADTNLTIPMTLFVSYKIPEERVYIEEFERIKKEHSWFKIIETITRAEESRMLWNGERRRINEELIKKYSPDFANCLFMVSGPSAMVEATNEIVKNMGVANEQIEIEKFTGY